MTLGNRVKQLRIDKGLTQKELAEPSYTHAYVSTIEAGRRQPSDEALRHIAAKLGVAEEELATGRPPDLLSRL
ncbi:MAG: helix-turn-helix domain-containing protein [Actinomycetota bacterium]|nr:helix-turn-helix domain-containing protein [Actinomycetota bacterium]